MFDLTSYWFWSWLVLLLIVFAVGNYKGRNLSPKRKALHELFYTFLLLGIAVYGLNFAFFFPSNFTSIPNVPETITNLEEAKIILQEQNKSLDSLLEKLTNLRQAVYIFLILFSVFLLPSIYRFAKAVIPNDEEKTPILNVTEKEPILGLNDE